MAFNDFSMVLTVVVLCIFLCSSLYSDCICQCSNKLVLSYFKYYIIKTQRARKSIVLKLCGYAAAFRPDIWGMVPQVGGCWGVRGVEMSLATGKDRLPVVNSQSVGRHDYVQQQQQQQQQRQSTVRML